LQEKLSAGFHISLIPNQKVRKYGHYNDKRKKFKMKEEYKCAEGT
jgi:hypothetical protein